MSLIIALLVILLVVVIAFYIIDMIPLPAPGNMIAKLIVGLVALVWLLQRLGIGI